MRPRIRNVATVTGTGHGVSMDASPAGTRARRWVILSEDGRYVTLGRATDPTPDEVVRAETAMREQGLAGWLAIMEGSPHSESAPRLMEVRTLNSPSMTFADAATSALASIADAARRL